MLEPPEISIADLIERARARFGILVDEAEFLPVGNDTAAWAYRISAGTDVWFLKVLGRPVDAASLEIPRYLGDYGVGHLIVPVPTVAGRPFDSGEPFSFIMYPFVDGRQGAETGLSTAHRVELGRLLRCIHDVRAPDELATIMRRERFEPRDVESARTMAERVRSGSFDDRLQRSLASIWLRHDREIDLIVERT